MMSRKTAGGLNNMKIRTANDLKELNAVLDKCKNPVWLMGPNDEAYNMKNEEEYIEGLPVKMKPSCITTSRRWLHK